MMEKLGGSSVVQNTASEFLLEYYLMEDQERNYGVKIEKTEKMSGNLVLREDYVSGYGIDDEAEANDVLKLLIKNQVTPTTADCVLHDLGYFGE